MDAGAGSAEIDAGGGSDAGGAPSAAGANDTCAVCATGGTDAARGVSDGAGVTGGVIDTLAGAATDRRGAPGSEASTTRTGSALGGVLTGITVGGTV